ncbi:MAG TPA: 1,2-phenylacetyl-CoA epoxidase subunit PaaD [Gemmatimonadaceae bacterium]|nr:1,2-phenylacetyl-CoA epoxidase subunit PaaD [Gemmatimonadaceae bacterium]
MVDLARRDASAAWAVLREVPDPEVPAISVVDLGIVRDVEVEEGVVTVTVTPTYSGCPAMLAIERDIVEALRASGADDVRVRTVYAPAWSSDWITAEGREKLRAYGIAPPGPAPRDDAPLVPLLRRSVPAPVPCPFCGSTRTTLRSEFGSTACKALRFCDACRQPFEEFKAI